MKLGYIYFKALIAFANWIFTYVLIKVNHKTIENPCYPYFDPQPTSY